MVVSRVVEGLRLGCFWGVLQVLEGVSNFAFSPSNL